MLKNLSQVPKNPVDGGYTRQNLRIQSEAF